MAHPAPPRKKPPLRSERRFFIRFSVGPRLQRAAGRVLCEQQGGGAREELIWSTLDQFEKTYVR